MTAGLRAYVVDDEPGALKQVVQSLRSTGRVEVVGSATAADTALTEIPDRDVEVLFLDIHMPGTTGFELLERLTTSPATKAPSATAGQKRRPRRKSAAMAIPVGAQTGVITPCATDSSMPS